MTAPEHSGRRFVRADGTGSRLSRAVFGGGDPCTDEGAVGSIELAGKLAEQAGWETDKGVHVGMTADELREIYPDAKQGSFPGLRDVTVLIEGPTAIGEAGTYPVHSARIEDERVSELRMYVGAAGD